MPNPHTLILNDSVTRAALKQAWDDSKPGITGGHEEGGFVLRDEVGNLSILRWLTGEQDEIFLPPHQECRIGDSEIVASFHTHPNTGDDYLQEPSETDKRSVRDDPDLKGDNYVGEFVISQDTIYLITPTGRVRELADTQEYFAEE